VFVLLTVCALSDEGGDFVLYVWKLVILLDEFYSPCDTGVPVYRVVVVLLNDCFLQFFRYFAGDLYDLVQHLC
jgi:hypothetical protein